MYFLRKSLPAIMFGVKGAATKQLAKYFRLLQFVVTIRLHICFGFPQVEKSTVRFI